MARISRADKEKKETAPITLVDNQGNVTAKYTAEMVDTIKNTVAKDATDAELIMYLTVANKYDLDPFLGEIYFAKYQDKAQIISGRNGYRKIAKRKPNFKKCQSMAVYENDNFEVIMEFGDIVNIKHSFTHKDRGKLLGAYAVLKTTDGDALFSYLELKEYDTRQATWKKYPSAMIKKSAETEVYKNFADISGIQAEETMPKGYEKERNTTFSNEKEDVEYVDVEVVEEVEPEKED